jgi:hypothetical protein
MDPHSPGARLVDAGDALEILELPVSGGGRLVDVVVAVGSAAAIAADAIMATATVASVMMCLAVMLLLSDLQPMC